MAARNPKRLFVLALDGTPYSYLKKAAAGGLMPKLSRLIAAAGHFSELHSVQPPVSSVAWASFMTGQLPVKHGITGFLEREPSTMEWYVPNGNHLQSGRLWEYLSDHGKRVFVMNVPMTYPPREVNGISICGFLGDDLTAGTYPRELGLLLKARGYRIDSDTELAKTDLERFRNDLTEVFEKRIETMWYFWEKELWDFFMVHIMETDRLHHFFWEYMEQQRRPYADWFEAFYQRIDALIGDVAQRLDPNTALLMLSDHGFTTLRREVYLNDWLREKGYLAFQSPAPQSLHDMQPGSRAYSFYPGRIYINLKGREKDGSVTSGIEYEQVCRQIAEELVLLRDPEGAAVIESVKRGYEVMGGGNGPAFSSGGDPRQSHLPDLVALPARGFDLKGNLVSDRLFKKGIFNGTHTFDDAFILSRGLQLPGGPLSIANLAAPIIGYFDLNPDDWEHRPLISRHHSLIGGTNP